MLLVGVLVCRFASIDLDHFFLLSSSSLPLHLAVSSLTSLSHQLQAYHVLTGHGIPPSQILTLSFDDAASSPFNPRPGTLINSPAGEDVRAGVPLDYAGSDVTGETFLAVLLGDAERVSQIAPNGTGRVLQSGPNDRLFVFYSDHGAPGLLGMPSGPPLYADQLVGALLNMTRRRDDADEEEGRAEEEGGFLFSPHRRHHHRHHDKEKKNKEKKIMLPGNATFSEVVLFVEACEAGSMFEGMLPPVSSSSDNDSGTVSSSSHLHRHHRRFHRDDGRGIFALTAANAHESSWGVYCPGMPLPPGEQQPDSPPVPDGFDTCLGDLFAVSWMRAAEDAATEPAESLEQLARVVAVATSRNGSYEMGSHVSEYGDVIEEREGAAAFLGVATGGGSEEDSESAGRRGRRGRGGDGSSEMRQQQERKEFSPLPSLASSSAVVPQRTADLLHLRLAAARPGAAEAEAAREALELELRHRETVDGAAAAVAAVLLLGDGDGRSGGGSGKEGGSGGGVGTEAVSRRLAEELSELHGIEQGGGGPAGGGAAAAAEAVATLVEAPLIRNRRADENAARLASSPLPVVDDWDCLRAGVRAFTESPGCAPPPPPKKSSSSSSSSQYALRHSKLVARACNAGVWAEEISAMVATACAGAATRVVSA